MTREPRLDAPRDEVRAHIDRLRRGIAPLPPPPGSFDRLSARARRRRGRRAIAGMASAALVAGGVVSVVLAVDLGTDKGVSITASTGGPGRANGRTPSVRPSAASTTAGKAPTASASSGPPSAAPTVRVPAAQPSGPVPPGFTPRSITFVTPRLGWVLGDAPCKAQPCTSLLRTADSGRTYTGLPAPRAALSDPALSPETAPAGTVREVRFVTPTDGFAYGRSLWATHDAGRSWHPVHVPGDTVTDFAAANGRAYLLVGSCEAKICLKLSVYSLAVATDALTPTALPRLAGDAYLAAQDRDVYVVGQARLADVFEAYVSRDGGRSIASPPTPVCRTSGGVVGGVSAGANGLVWVGCNGPAGAKPGAEVSLDAGASFRQTGPPPVLGGVGGIGKSPATSAAAVGADGAYLTGEDTIASTADLGTTWTEVVLPGASKGTRLVFVGFTDPTHGYVIAGGGGPPGLWRTENGGRSWTQVVRFIGAG